MNKKKIVQITTADERWYVRDSKNKETGLPEYEFVPSVTWICGFYPKGIEFYKWLASKGWNEAEAIKNAAGDKGSKIHLAIADLLSGNEVKINSQYLNKTTGQLEELTLDEYAGVMSFFEWCKEINPEIVGFEFVVWNNDHNYAGTVDLKCKINNELWIIDVKSGQYVWPEHELQVSAYKHADGDDAKLAILQVGYHRNKKEWKFTEIQDQFELFLGARRVWAKETTGINPLQKDYPMSLKIEKVGTQNVKLKIKSKIKTK